MLVMETLAIEKSRLYTLGSESTARTVEDHVVTSQVQIIEAPIRQTDKRRRDFLQNINIK